MSEVDQSAKGRIDVHHHILPDFYVEALKNKGVTEAGGRKFPEWSVANTLEMMDRNGIRTAISSISSPGVHFGDQQDAQNLARDCNEFMAEMRDNQPGRFGGFAVLPLPDVEASLSELEYALDTLSLDGVIMLSSIYGGYRPAASRFLELFSELNRRKSVVFLHPDRLIQDLDPNSPIPPFLVDFVYDTTRAVVELIYSGICHKYPDIKFVISHAGGTLPYIAWRIAQVEKWPEYRDKVPEGVMHHLRRFYYDTALSASRYSMTSLMELVGESQILFGSDYVFVPETVVEASIRRIGRFEGFNSEALQKVERGNAETLFGKFG